MSGSYSFGANRETGESGGNLTNPLPLQNDLAARSLTQIDGAHKTSVFVGNISDFTTDSFMQQLLGKCGAIANWKRVVGSNGKLQSFGFCEYVDQEAGLRAMRILHDMKIGDKMLVVKVDAKTRALLDEYENKQKIMAIKRLAVQNYSMPLTGSALMRTDADNRTKRNIDLLLQQNSDLLSGKLDASIYNKDKNPQFEDGQISDDDNDISKEIDRELKIHRKRRSSRDRDRSRRRRSSSGRGDKYSYAKNVSKLEEREFAQETRKADRLRMEKEKIFKEKVKRYESVERHREEFLDDIKQRNKKKAKKMKEYTSKLKKFLSSYDDDIDDDEHYKGDAWERKLDKRANEIEKDKLDEKDEIEEIRMETEEKEKQHKQKLDELKVELPKLKEESTFPTKSVSSDDQSKNEYTQEPSYNMDVKILPGSAPLEIVDQLHSTSPMNDDGYEQYDAQIYDPEIKSKVVEKPQEWQTIDEITSDQPVTTLNTAIKINQVKQISQPVVSVTAPVQPLTYDEDEIFPDENEVNTSEKKPAVKKKTALPIITDAEHKEVPLVELPPGYHVELLTPKERKLRIKKIIESIPVDKDELFQEKIRWDHVDKKLVTVRLKPWVSKRIKEFIGEEDDSLINFICNKVYDKCQPQEIIDSISMILDKDAESFTIKLWRFLIYEATAKMYGLVEYSD